MAQWILSRDGNWALALCFFAPSSFFAFFGFADEAKKSYRFAFQSVANRVGFSTGSSTFGSGIDSSDYGSEGCVSSSIHCSFYRWLFYCFKYQNEFKSFRIICHWQWEYSSHPSRSCSQKDASTPQIHGLLQQPVNERRQRCSAQERTAVAIRSWKEAGLLSWSVVRRSIDQRWGQSQQRQLGTVFFPFPLDIFEFVGYQCNISNAGAYTPGLGGYWSLLCIVTVPTTTSNTPSESLSQPQPQPTSPSAAWRRCQW